MRVEVRVVVDFEGGGLQGGGDLKLLYGSVNLHFPMVFTTERVGGLPYLLPDGIFYRRLRGHCREWSSGSCETKRGSAQHRANSTTTGWFPVNGQTLGRMVVCRRRCSCKSIAGESVGQRKRARQ
jgi:hypothetical protein